MYRMTAIDLSKQQALDADPKAIQNIRFAGNLDQSGNTTIFLLLEKVKEVVLNLSQRTLRVFWILSYFNEISI